MDAEATLIVLVPAVLGENQSNKLVVFEGIFHEFSISWLEDVKAFEHMRHHDEVRQREQPCHAVEAIDMENRIHDIIVSHQPGGGDEFVFTGQNRPCKISRMAPPTRKQ